MPEQLELQLFADVTQLSEAELSRRQIIRAVLAWLNVEECAGLALNVNTRVSRFRADIAAFWNHSRRNPSDQGPGRILTVSETTIVECRADRQQCWPDYARSNQLLPNLCELKRRRERMEAQLREDEPYLRATDTLFEEYAEWNYSQSQNAEYQQLRKEISSVEDAIYNGTRFETIANAGVASNLYLAVPEGTVEAHEVADGWGLLWVDDQMNVKVIEKARPHDCADTNLAHLVQNIATAATPNVLFSQGIYLREGEPEFLQPPRRRQRRSNSA